MLNQENENALEYEGIFLCFVPAVIALSFYHNCAQEHGKALLLRAWAYRSLKLLKKARINQHSAKRCIVVCQGAIAYAIVKKCSANLKTGHAA